MKKIFKTLLIVLLISGGIITNNEVRAQQVNVSLSVFQKSLSPYGRWINNGTYGQVWIANDRNFIPYETGGHWAYTDYGWTWVSDYDWGWAPFHYGRWNYEASTGWYWVPGYDWGPAWVAWRGGGDYYGWAPLSPGLNISVGVSFGNQIPYDRWVFAPHRYITSPYISRYYVPRTRNVTIIKNTTIVNNVTVRNNVHVDAGPKREEVERINHTRIKTYTVSNSSRPGKTVVNNNTINVYRPVVNKTTINNNNKTVINKNSNNKTVNKTNNKTTVNKNSDNKTVINKNNNNKTSTVKKRVTNTQQNNITAKKPVANKNKPEVNKNATDKLRNKPVLNKVNNSNKEVGIKNHKHVNAKPAVRSANKNKPQVKEPAQEKNNNPPSNNKRDGKKK